MKTPTTHTPEQQAAYADALKAYAESVITFAIADETNADAIKVAIKAASLAGVKHDDYSSDLRKVRYAALLARSK